MPALTFNPYHNFYHIFHLHFFAILNIYIYIFLHQDELFFHLVWNQQGVAKYKAAANIYRSILDRHTHIYLFFHPFNDIDQWEDI